MGLTSHGSKSLWVDHGPPSGSMVQILHLVGHGVLQPSNVKYHLVDSLCFNRFSNLFHESASHFTCIIPNSLNTWFLDQNRSLQHRITKTDLFNTDYLNHISISIILFNQLVNNKDLLTFDKRSLPLRYVSANMTSDDRLLPIVSFFSWIPSHQTLSLRCLSPKKGRSKDTNIRSLVCLNKH